MIWTRLRFRESTSDKTGTRSLIIAGRVLPAPELPLSIEKCATSNAAVRNKTTDFTTRKRNQLCVISNYNLLQEHR